MSKPRNIQFAAAGRTEMLAAGNFGDWHAAVGEVLKTTTWQSGILCGWPSRLEQPTAGHSFGTYIINVPKHAQDTSVFSFLLH